MSTGEQGETGDARVVVGFFIALIAFIALAVLWHQASGFHIPWSWAGGNPRVYTETPVWTEKFLGLIPTTPVFLLGAAVFARGIPVQPHQRYPRVASKILLWLSWLVPVACALGTMSYLRIMNQPENLGVAGLLRVDSLALLVVVGAVVVLLSIRWLIGRFVVRPMVDARYHRQLSGTIAGSQADIESAVQRTASAAEWLDDFLGKKTEGA